MTKHQGVQGVVYTAVGYFRVLTPMCYEVKTVGSVLQIYTDEGWAEYFNFTPMSYTVCLNIKVTVWCTPVTPPGFCNREGNIGGGRGQWGHHGKCGARAYNGGLGAEPPARSRGRAPGQGGAKPP